MGRRVREDGAVSVRILVGDCRERLRELPDASVHCCVTSPPYFGLRDYGHAGQMGLEPTPDEFVAGMVAVFREVKRVLRDDGTLWLNLGDSYAANGARANNNGGGATGLKRDGRPEESRLQSAAKTKTLGMALPAVSTGLASKQLLGIPWMLAFALRADGWYLRQDIIWSKPNPMPESVRDRCTKAHEYLFLLSKSARYHFDAEAIAEVAIRAGDIPGGNKSVDASRGDAARDMSRPVGETRNKRSVWEVATQPFSGAHFATFPPALIEPCILAGCPKGGTVLDPFGGAGTTGLVADRLQRDAILVELNPEYAALAQQRLSGDGGMFSEVLAA